MRPTLIPLSVPTPFGSATLTPDGWLHVTAYPSEVISWADREDAAWPCSWLARCTKEVSATFDSGGNLIDVEHPGIPDVPAYELTAWTSDVARLAGFGSHPSVQE